MTSINSNIPIIILAGGKGERFINKENLPKQLTTIAKHPIIIEIILYYFKKGFNHFILPLGYKVEFFLDFFKNAKNIKKYNLKILKNKNDKLDNSKINILIFNSGIKDNKLIRIKKSIKLLDENIRKIGVCYGDIFANVSFKKELSYLEKKNISGVVAGFNEKSPYGHLDIKNNIVKKFFEKPKLKDPINIGFYFFSKKIFSNLDIKTISDLEADFLPKLCKFNKLACYIHKGFHFTVNSQKDLIQIKKKYKKNKNFFSNF